MKTEREYRTLAMSMRARDEPKAGEMIVEGYATTFNSTYELYRKGKYTVMEQVDRHAFDDCDMSDVIMQFDHAGRVYARTRNGSLHVEPDEHGLKITADLSRTESARQLYDEIRAGMIDRMSFGFVVDQDEWTRKEDMDSGSGTKLRTITRMRKLYDVSAVSIPANDQTQIAVRTMCERLIAQCEAERLKGEQKRRLALRIKMMEADIA